MGSFCEWDQQIVEETSQEIPIENVQLIISTGRLVAKAKPRPKPVVNLSSNYVPIKERIWIDINPEPFNEGCFAVSKFMIRSVRHESSIPREDDEAVRFDDLIEKFKVKFAGALQWTVDDWENCLAKCGREKRRFQYCMNPYSSDKCLCIRAIQEHSEGNLVDSLLHENVMLPDDFTEHIGHIGNAFEMHSIIKSGLIPGGKAPEGTGSQRSSQPWTRCARQDLEGVECDLDKPRIAPCKHTWKAHHNTVYWCNFKPAQRRGLQFYQTRSHAITLSSTLPVICLEKVVCMKTGGKLHCKVCRSSRLPRLTLVPNSQHDQKDVPITDWRKSDDCENEINEQRVTCSSSRVDFRIPGIPHSTVEKVETKRKEKVRRLIEQFENHQTGICCWWTTRNRRRSTTSVENQRIWLLKWAIPRSSNAARLLRRDSVQIAPHTGKMVSYTAHAENACSRRKMVDNTTKTGMTYCVTPCHIACTDADKLSAQHIELNCYTLTRGSSCAFHKIVIPHHVSRHVSRPAQHTYLFDINFTFIHVTFSCLLKVDHVQNPPHRFTRPQRWRFCGSTTSHRLWAHKDCRQPDRHWARDWALCWRESDSRNWG